MYTKFAITITEEKDNKVKQTVVEMETLLGVVRFMMTYRPSRGHKVVNWNIDEVQVLV